MYIRNGIQQVQFFFQKKKKSTEVGFQQTIQ